MTPPTALTNALKLLALTAAAAAVLTACGGGGGTGAATGGIEQPATPAATSASFAQQCASDNPFVADASSSTTAGTLSTEKQWIRSYLDETYLWYDSIPAVNAAAASYSGSMALLDSGGVPLPLGNYFNALKTRLTTPSGALADRFSFAYPTKEWRQLAQSGVTAGYGIEWVAINRSAPNRLWRVAVVQPNSPALAAGIMRGDTIKTVDGIDYGSSSDSAALNAGIYPASGSTHTLVFTRSGSPDVVAKLTGSAAVTIDPVPLATVVTDPLGRKVGYLHFTDHFGTSEAKLINAITTLQAQNVSDLVLDMRYNGGGYLYIASELAYMIAGPSHVSGKYFEKLQFNAKRSADNAQEATPFYNESCGPDANGNCVSPQALPSLNLARVFVITTNDTCSASESVINGLMGVNVDVQLIGGTTCGKPYGFTPRDNCGVSYFPIEFKGVNFKGFGDYADGFAPTSGSASGANLAGCPSTDDLDTVLGKPTERMLNAALQRAAYGTCPAASMATRQSVLPMGRLQRSPTREMRLLLPAGGQR
jgi:hypothetical protein